MNRLLLTLSIVVVVFLSKWNFCDSFKANVCDKLKVFFGLRQELYSCVIECGNRKCQLACYSFIPSKSGRNLWLNKKFYKCSIPRVNEIVHEPEKFKETIDVLLEGAKKNIPKAAWQETPLILVGRPSLHDIASKYEIECLKHVMTSHLKNTGFLMPQEPMVLFTNTNEGLLSFFTHNLMLGLLRSMELRAVAVLNLEMSANQVTFVASKEEQKLEKYQQYISSENFGTNNNFNIYSRGFPQLGISVVRKKIIENGTFEGGVYYTDCMSEYLKGYWFYKNTTYRVTGSKLGPLSMLKSKDWKYVGKGVNIEKCRMAVQRVVQPLPECPSLSGRQIYGLNSYFQAFAKAGLVDPIEGGSFSMADLHNAVKDTCRNKDFIEELLCMDFVYIDLLLRDFYKLRGHDTIYLTGKIRKCEVKATLGIAYLNLMAQVKKAK
ncbi:hypothetical protein RUM44_008229 [Polyplax serrata]|uniref:Uncharacterized protein n=1 Tax=Polyplax serrata TaxID=468196 RepID=A0ABR1BBQ5_POLSC